MKLDVMYKMGRSETEASASVLPFYMPVALPTDGCIYLQKHAVLFMNQ
jgi:hypothetical protein